MISFLCVAGAERSPPLLLVWQAGRHLQGVRSGRKRRSSLEAQSKAHTRSQVQLHDHCSERLDPSSSSCAPSNTHLPLLPLPMSIPHRQDTHTLFSHAVARLFKPASVQVCCSSSSLAPQLSPSPHTQEDTAPQPPHSSLTAKQLRKQTRATPSATTSAHRQLTFSPCRLGTPSANTRSASPRLT